MRHATYYYYYYWEYYRMENTQTYTQNRSVANRNENEFKKQNNFQCFQRNWTLNHHYIALDQIRYKTLKFPLKPIIQYTHMQKIFQTKYKTNKLWFSKFLRMQFLHSINFNAQIGVQALFIWNHCNECILTFKSIIIIIKIIKEKKIITKNYCT